MTQGHHIYLMAVIARDHPHAGQPAFRGLSLSQTGSLWRNDKLSL
jgi:hypothetical protein